MVYFSYHGEIRKLVMNGELEKVVFVERYKQISPALVLLFKTHTPMPVRQHRFKEYKEFLKKYGFEVEIPDKYMWFAFFLWTLF